MTISISNVSKRYGDFLALDRISLEIAEHSLTAILGPSGSGKSTLLRVIAGLETPDEGAVHILGQDVTPVKPQDRGVGFVFQHYAAFKHMTVWENVAFGLKVRHQRKDEIRSTVSRLLKLVQLEGFAERYPSQLSGGQRQRMALARALAIQPRVLLLDEPFGALDAKVRKELRDWLRRLHEEVGVTAVLVTHDQEEAMDAAESIVVMNHGRIEQLGTAMEVYDHPVNDFVMSFIGDVNHIDGRLIRPHHVRLSREPDSSGDEMVIDRLVHLGYAVRADLVGSDGKLLRAEMTRDEASDLGLEKGQNVFVSLPEDVAVQDGTPVA